MCHTREIADTIHASFGRPGSSTHTRRINNMGQRQRRQRGQRNSVEHAMPSRTPSGRSC